MPESLSHMHNNHQIWVAQSVNAIACNEHRYGKSREIAKNSPFEREIPRAPGNFRAFYPFPFPGNFITGKYGNTATVVQLPRQVT